jgi:hypothetical protein
VVTHDRDDGPGGRRGAARLGDDADHGGSVGPPGADGRRDVQPAAGHLSVLAVVSSRVPIECACAIVLGAVFVAPSARADLKVEWDCYLPDTGVDCALLESSLTSKIPFVKVVTTPGDADLTATLTSVPAENGTRFRFDFVGKPLDGYVTQVHSTDKIPSSIDATTATVRILTRIERGLDDFMDQKLVAELKNGKLEIQLNDPAHLPFSGRPEQSSVKWYVAPSIGSYFSDVVGVGINAQATASLSFNYSGRMWRAQQEQRELLQGEPAGGRDDGDGEHRVRGR